MHEFKDKGKTVLFVTHDQGTVINFCNYVYWLKDGKIFEQGDPRTVVKKYTSYMAYGLETSEQEDEIDDHSVPVLNENDDTGQAIADIEWLGVSECASFGEGGAQITDVALVHQGTNEVVSVLNGGEQVCFNMKLQVCKVLEKAGIGISVADQLGNVVFAIPSFVYDYTIPILEKGQELICQIEFDFPKIKKGKYSVSAAIGNGSQINHEQHHWVHDVCFVEISNTDLKYTLGSSVIEKSKFSIEYISS